MSRVIAALNWPRRIHDAIVYAKFVAQRLASDPVFADPIPPLAVVEADIAALEEAEVRALTRALGTAKARDAKLQAVHSDLDGLRTYVQHVADGSPTVETAAAIIESAGMSVKKSSGHGKTDFEVKQGPVSGSVHLVARAEPTRASYQWEYGTEEGAWTPLDPTVRSDAKLHGLTSALPYFFRYRAVTKAGIGNWSQVVSFLVQ